jgi:hypothetical protein
MIICADVDCFTAANFYETIQQIVTKYEERAKLIQDILLNSSSKEDKSEHIQTLQTRNEELQKLIASNENNIEVLNTF